MIKETEKMRSDKYEKKNQIAKSGGGSATAGHGKKKFRWNKKQFFKFVLAVILAIILAVLAYAVVVIATAPKIDTSKIYSILTESTVIYDSNGKQVDSVYEGENRTNVKYSQMPKNLINAYVALEDKTFWKHHGFNFVRIMGAIKDSVFGGGQVSGTSTITQQLARNVFLKSDMTKHTLKRKIREAWYTVLLEKNLSKEQIIEAYLNTINLGYGSYGVEAASQAYFSKDVEDLTLSQCAALASLPQAPSSYALVQILDNDSVSTTDKNILKRTSIGTYVINDAGKDRRETCLALMKKQGYITQAEYDKAIKVSLKKMLNPSFSTGGNSSMTYFTDYVVSQVISDLQKENDLSYSDAYDKVYSGGLKIYSTVDSKAQKVIQKEFKNDSNFPTPTNIRYDSSGNILNSLGQIAMYDYKDYFSDGSFTFKSGEATLNSDGSLVIKKNKRLNIYKTTVNGKTDYSIEFPTMYLFKNSKLYSISGGYINVPQKYKTADSDGNVIVSAKYMKSKAGKNFFNISGSTISIPRTSYTLNQKTIQPQSAMTIVENSTGEIKAMMGGRKTTGRMLYNRATNPRQPGSSIKPLAVYSAALQQSAEEAKAGKKHTFTDFGIDAQGTKGWGKFITAGSIVVDEKTTVNGRTWPYNSGGGYSGKQTLRSALRNSINTCAVKIWYQVGTSYSATMVKKYGITTLDTKGSVSDLNAAALALGGMTNGVTTTEMANAYTTFPNNGTKAKDTICYTKVEDNEGKTLLKKSDAKKTRVLDSGVAWIMTDLLKGVVSGGTGTGAALSSVTVGGKTGTTSDEYDIWFDGFTPSYSASLWIGNDVNIQLSSMSGYAASLWGKIMGQIPNASKGSYKSMPSDVTRVNGEYYITGTYSAVSYADTTKKATICTDSGYLATPSCPNTETKTYDTSKGENPPTYYCYKHNPDPDKYPVSPSKKVSDNKDQNTNKDEDTNKDDNTTDDDTSDDTGN